MAWLTRFLAALALAIVLVIPAGALSAPGQGERVGLVFTWKPEEISYRTVTATASLTLELMGRQGTVQQELQAREATRVLNVSQDGTMLIEIALENLKVTTDGRTATQFAEPQTIRVRPHGQVLETKTGPNLNNYPFNFPDRPIAVGDSWTYHGVLENWWPPVAARVSKELTLVGIDRIGNDRVARIRTREDGTVTRVTVPVLRELTGRDPDTAEGRWQARGEIRWSLDRGRMLLETKNIEIDARFEFTGPAGTLAGRQILKLTERREPLAATSVKVREVPSQFRIVPGRSIGATALDMSVAELTNRLGTPRTLEGAHSTRLTILVWPGGPEVYVDPADITKLAGLYVEDAQFSTDRGIGFGSSQGAVLLSYGMMPTQLEISIPDLGGVRMLIYNDLGIAFAITSDRKHAARGPDHAPIGAVDWIVVFRPGEAAKIYTVREKGTAVAQLSGPGLGIHIALPFPPAIASSELPI